MLSMEGLVDSYYPSLNKTRNPARKLIVSFLRTLFHEAEIQQFEKRYACLEGLVCADEAPR